MKPVDIKVDIVYKEALTYCCVTISICINVELNFICLELCFVGCKYLLLVSEDNGHVPIWLSFKFCEQI